MSPLDRKIKTVFYQQRARTLNPNCKEYPWYGAKGIRRTYSWAEFHDFVYPRVKDLPLKSWSVGRIDHSKNYEIGNIEIVTRSENSKERIRRIGTPFPRVRIVRTHDDGSITVYASRWACRKISGLGLATVHKHINKKLKGGNYWLFTAEEYFGL